MGATARTADFSNVKEGGPRFTKKRVKAGDYLAKIVKVEDAQIKATKEFQYLFTIQLVKHPGATYPYYCQLTEKTLWKLRNLMIAAGKSVPKKKTKVDPNLIVGKTIGVTMEDTEYDDKPQSEIDAVFPAADLTDDDGDDDASDNVDEDSEDEEAEEEAESNEEDGDDEAEDEEDEEEADEEEESDPYADLDRAALKAALKRRDPSFQARTSQSDDDLRNLLRAGDSDSEDEEDEEEEAEPEPPKKAKKAEAAPAKKSTKKKSKDVSDEELEELDIDDL